MKNKPKIFCILGYTSSGKTGITQAVSEQLNLPQIVTHTSRPKREGEIDGKDYNFVEKEMFISNSFDFLEQRHYKVANGDTWYYGVNKYSLNNKPYSILIIDRGGCDEIINNLGESNVTTIFIEVPITELCKRHFERGDDTDEFNRRLKDDIEKFKGFVSDYIVTNIDFEDSVKQVKSIIVDEMMESEL